VGAAPPELGGVDVGEGVELELARQGTADLVVARQREVSAAECAGPGRVAHPDIGEGAHVAAEVPVDVAARVVRQTSVPWG